MAPCVSVIMPVYNQDRFIAEAIESVRDQSFQDWELVVVDDGSTDATPEVVARFEDSRIRCVHQVRHGVSHARNEGVARSSGEYIAFLDADDRYHPDKLLAHVSHLDRASRVGMSYSPHIRIDQAGQPWTVHWPPESVSVSELVLGFPFNPSATVIRRSWHDEIGGYDTSFVINEDREYHVRLALGGCQMARAGGCLTYYRVHAGRGLHDLPAKMDDMLRALRTAFGDPRCPEDSRALHGRAHRGIYFEWAYQAAIAEQTSLAHAYSREALRFDPLTSKASADELLLAWVEAATRNRAEHESLLRKVFAQLPPELEHFAAYEDWSLASADLIRGARDLIWGRSDEAHAYLGRAVERRVRLDERVLWPLRYDLQNAQAGLGIGVTTRVLRDIAPYLKDMAGRRNVRRLEGMLSTSRSADPPLRIAFLLNGFPLLSETFILNQITGLIDRGHEVLIFIRSPRHEPKVHEDVDRYRLLDKTHTLLVNKHTLGHRLLYSMKVAYLLAKSLPRYPRRVLRALARLETTRVRGSLIDLHPVAVLMDKGPYDVVHAHFGLNGVWASHLRQAGAFPGKLVTTFHDGLDLSVYLNDKETDVYADLFQQGDLLMAVSDKIRDRLVSLGCDVHKVIVHRVGVGVARFGGIKKETGEGRIRLTSVARLVERKGLRYAIEAVAKLSEKYDQIEYVIAGDGPARPGLQALIETLDVSRVVRLLGWQSQEEIAALLRTTDLLLAPSVTDPDGSQEGIPTVLMEALAQEIPVLATWHAGIPELVRHGESGLLVPERDVAALVEGLEYLIQNRDSWPEMGRRGHTQVETHFSIERQNDRLVRIYRQLQAERAS